MPFGSKTRRSVDVVYALTVSRTVDVPWFGMNTRLQWLPSLTQQRSRAILRYRGDFIRNYRICLPGDVEYEGNVMTRSTQLFNSRDCIVIMRWGSFSLGLYRGRVKWLNLDGTFAGVRGSSQRKVCLITHVRWLARVRDHVAVGTILLGEQLE